MESTSTPKPDRNGVRLRDQPGFNFRENSGGNPRGCGGKKGQQQAGRSSILFCGARGAEPESGGRKPAKRRPKKAAKAGGIKGDALVLNGWSSG